MGLTGGPSGQELARRQKGPHQGALSYPSHEANLTPVLSVGMGWAGLGSAVPGPLHLALPLGDQRATTSTTPTARVAGRYSNLRTRGD